MLKKKYFKTKDECEVTFEYSNSNAQEVALLIEANDWQPVPMKKRKGGLFQTKMRLPKGSEFEFRYLVDGRQWENDQAADGYRRNEHGSENSVVTTRDG